MNEKQSTYLFKAISFLLILLVCGGVSVGGYKVMKWGMAGFENNCFHCDNARTNETCMDLLMEQEYGDNNYCNDLGNYEMAIKIGMGMLVTGVMVFILIICIRPFREEKLK